MSNVGNSHAASHKCEPHSAWRQGCVMCLLVAAFVQQSGHPTSRWRNYPWSQVPYRCGCQDTAIEDQSLTQTFSPLFGEPDRRNSWMKLRDHFIARAVEVLGLRKCFFMKLRSSTYHPNSLKKNGQNQKIQKGNFLAQQKIFKS